MDKPMATANPTIPPIVALYIVLLVESKFPNPWKKPNTVFISDFTALVSLVVVFFFMSNPSKGVTNKKLVPFLYIMRFL